MVLHELVYILPELVSEDNDLLVLNPYRGISILTALEFLQALNDRMKG